MRLQKSEIAQIRETIIKEFGECQIYIFGSQLNESKRGGDIDIYIIPQEQKELRAKESKVKFILEERLLKPIDILIHSDFSREIEEIALEGVNIGEIK
jgi:predicted nucleotidyltransferase